MNPHDSPDRYEPELDDPNEDSTGPTATVTMRRYALGDYVLFTRYDELLDAYKERGRLLDQIERLAANA